jgi:hypothetical protein
LIFPPSLPPLDSLAPDEVEPRSDWPLEEDDVVEPEAVEELEPPAEPPPTETAGP